MRAGRQGARLEVREERGVLLGGLGDAVDRRPLPGLELGEREPGGTPLRRGHVDRVAVGARLGMPQELVEASLHARRDRALEPRRLHVRLGPPEADHRRQQPFQEGVAAEDGVGRGLPGGRQRQLAPLALGHQAVGAEAADHLARGLRGDADLAGDVGGGHPAAVAGRHAEGEQVLLGGAREVGRGAAGHAEIVPRADGRGTGSCRPRLRRVGRDAPRRRPRSRRRARRRRP